MRPFLLILLAFSLNATCFTQEIKWIKFSDLANNMRKESKPIMIFIHTDWCKFCKMQESKTFTDSSIIDNLNNNYYCLKLNGEEKNDITFLGKTYKFISTGLKTGEHELAKALGTKNNKITYPTTIVLTSKFELLTRLAGFQAVTDLKKL